MVVGRCFSPQRWVTNSPKHSRLSLSLLTHGGVPFLFQLSQHRTGKPQSASEADCVAGEEDSPTALTHVLVLLLRFPLCKRARNSAITEKTIFALRPTTLPAAAHFLFFCRRDFPLPSAPTLFFVIITPGVRKRR